MKTKSKILVLALIGILFLPHTIVGAQNNADENEQPILIKISISKENGFVPQQFEAQAGKAIMIELTSDDNSVHGLRFAEKNLKNLTMGVNPGQTTSITFEAPKELGNYSFYCTAPGHKRKGEIGIMIVVKPILTNPARMDEDVTAADLGIEEPKMLSTNIFYPLKSLWNNIKISFTADPIKKAEMRLDIANEKLIEAKKLTEEFDEPEKAIQAINAYEKEISKSIKIMENITENNQINAQTLSDKIIDNSFKQQMLMDGLAEKLDIKGSNEMNNAKEKSIKYISVIVDEVISPEKIESKMIEIVKNQTGSEFKDFKNIEILRSIEKKVPEQAKEAIRKAQENTIQRLIEKIRTINEEKTETFKNYIEDIGGNEIHHLRVIEDITKMEISDDVRQTINNVKEISIERISDRIEKISDETQDNFLDDLKTEKIEDLRIIKELENSVSLQAKDKIIETKKEVLQKINKNILESTNTQKGEEEYLVRMGSNNDIKQLEALEEIENIVPANKKDIILKAKNETVRKIKEDIAQAENEEEKDKILSKIAGDQIGQIKIIRKIDDANSSVVLDILEKQSEKIQNKIRITENTATLEQLQERILQENKEKNNKELKQIGEQVESKIKLMETKKNEKAKEEKDRTQKPQETTINKTTESLSMLKRSTNCIQVITPARNPDNNICINFPTPCDVPSGWDKVENCVQADKEEDINTLTCTELCGSLGYRRGICRKWAIVPSAKMGCRDNEIKVSATSDCFVPTSLVGLSKACCCSTPDKEIIPARQGDSINKQILNTQPSGEIKEKATKDSQSILLDTRTNPTPEEGASTINKQILNAQPSSKIKEKAVKDR